LINYYKEDKGVFASRSPRRPSSIGVTTVKLIERKGCALKVAGLDALHGTPVIDIKPTDLRFYKENSTEITTERSKQNPRWEITQAIRTNNLEYLLLEAGKMHGHFCVGLALGIRAATYAMQNIDEFSDGMEDLVAITETNNCSSDGVQFVTGCSFGNNALIFKDFGKNAFSLVSRNGKGIRIVTKNGSGDYIRSVNPDFYKQFSKVIIEKNHDPEEKRILRKVGMSASFNVLELDFDKLFNVEKVDIELPEYAPIHESIACTCCGENTMATRIIEKDGEKLCLNCHAKDYKQLDGHGIKCIQL
jgi:formylmethanofuran dehydrogenase subunit E